MRKGAHNMKILMILNDPPYGTERVYNGLRLAGNLLAKHDAVDLTVFLLGDSVSAGKRGQQTPTGYYNVERMLAAVVRRGGQVLLCGTCLDARGLDQAELSADLRRSTLDELTDLTVAADQVLVF